MSEAVSPLKLGLVGRRCCYGTRLPDSSRAQTQKQPGGYNYPNVWQSQRVVSKRPDPQGVAICLMECGVLGMN